jgi:hypothetical protein
MTILPTGRFTRDDEGACAGLGGDEDQAVEIAIDVVIGDGDPW